MQTQYGDETLGYSLQARDMTPEGARAYLEHNINDGIYMLIPDERRMALEKRAGETE